jgi:hypothetical protein
MGEYARGMMELATSGNNLRQIADVSPKLEIKISVKHPGRTIGDEP